MVKKYEQVYSAILQSLGKTMTSGDPHVQENGVDLWTPQGDVTIIGCNLQCVINPLPNSALGNLGGAYIYADVGIVARQDEERSLIIACKLAVDPLELPTVGEHALTSPVSRAEQVIFPAGFGIDVDRWHPVYLNIGYRTFYSAGNLEVASWSIIWYVER